MSTTLAQYQETPALIDAALATSPKPITDSVAISILKHPLIQAWILQQIINANGSP